MSARLRKLERVLRGEERASEAEAKFVERFNVIAAKIIGEKVGHIVAENEILRERITAFNKGDLDTLIDVLDNAIYPERPVRVEILRGKIEDLLRARDPVRGVH